MSGDQKSGDQNQFTPRVFSGAQPTGNMHLGNYLGAFRNWVKLQDDFEECVYCVVDMHAITTWQDPAALRQQIREAAAAYIATGIDTEKSILFNQSQVAGHAELAWVFNCVARMGWLNRMTQFKDKAGKNREKVSTGLFVYPNLMAADILLYKGTHVPVGEDQKQHLELTRDIASSFNEHYGTETFPLTEPVIQEEAARIMSLRDGTKKMSKSEPSDMSRINLTDDADTIMKKIRKAKTDPEPIPSEVDGLEGRAEAKNLLTIYGALTDKSLASVCQEFSGQGFADFKKSFVDVAVDHLAPITEEMARLMANPDHVDDVLRKGSERARAIAEPIMQEVKDVIGYLS